MTLDSSQNARRRAALLAALLAGVVLAGGAGYWLGDRGSGDPAQTTASNERAILYYYDPMVPQERYDNPDALSSMGMKTIPKYADDSGGAKAAPGISIDPAAMQNLGIRVVAAKAGTLAGSLAVTGTIDFNQRDVAIVQARAGGFVQRTYGRAPGDIVRSGAPIADLLIPEWGGAQAEYLSVRRLGRPALTTAARQRLQLLGMSEATIRNVERGGRQRGTITITTPVGGVIQTLDVRQGMTLAAGQTLAQVTGLGTVWLNAAVPEARAADVRPGQSATAQLTGFPGETFTGRVIAVLPTADAASRTLTVRIELANRGGRLRPGMFANVAFGEAARSALLVPTEAVIRTGTRTIVMLASKEGRYRPAEVTTGRDSGGQTEILAGLSAGEKVVASGQFLLDSEASLTGIAVRPLSGASR